MGATMHNKAKSGIIIYPAQKRMVSAGFYANRNVT
jgi:hypothetical protein